MMSTPQPLLNLRPPLSTAILHWQELGLVQPDNNPFNSFRLTPKTQQHVADMLSWVQAEGFKIAFSQQAAQLLEESLWLDLSALNQIDTSQSADFIVKVQTGATFGELSAALAQQNQMFPLHYPASMTIAEILANDCPALETGIRGYPRDYVLRTEIATTDGQLTTSGADVVKNVTGYDLHKLYTGGRNAFGCLTQVTLKVQALTCDSQTFLTNPLLYPDAVALMSELQTATLPLSICELFSSPPPASSSPPECQWQIMIDVSGSITTDALPVGTWQALDASATTRQKLALQQWPVDTGVLEIALPLSAWSAWMTDFSNTQSTTENAQYPWHLQGHIQIRPKAGLIYLSRAGWQDAKMGIVETIRTLATQHHGFVQWAQWPSSAYQRSESCGLSNFWQKAVEINQPSDPIQRELLQKIRTSYDPDGILFVPELPLTPLKANA